MAVFDDLGRRYREKALMFTAAIAGERALATAAGLPAGSSLRWSRAQNFKDGFLADFANDAQRYLQDYAGNVSDEFQLRAQNRFAHAYVELTNIAAQVVDQTTKQAKFGVESPIKALHRMPAGAIGLLAQKRLADPIFKVRDSARREWQADKLVEVIVRDFAYQTFVDHQFDEAIQSGATEVTLQHPAEDHPFQDATIQLDANWLVERDKTFHINSSLTISYATV